MGQNGHRARNAVKAQQLRELQQGWGLIRALFVGGGIVAGILLAALTAAAGWMLGLVE
ncbi:MAG: hypothetical protein WCR06_07720 [bacterium]